jgi:hypothetical protein
MVQMMQFHILFETINGGQKIGGCSRGGLQVK